MLCWSEHALTNTRSVLQSDIVCVYLGCFSDSTINTLCLGCFYFLPHPSGKRNLTVDDKLITSEMK